MDEEKGEGEDFWGRIKKYAVNAGTNEILKNHPGWMSYRDSIITHIDPWKLDRELREVQKETGEKLARGEFVSEDQLQEHVYQEVVQRVTSGRVFDDFANETMLNKGLEERVNDDFYVGGAVTDPKDMDNISKIIGANNKFYGMMKSGDYAKRMPELAEAVEAIKDAGMLTAAIDILKYHGLMDARRYDTIKRALEEKIMGNYNTEVTKLEEYSAHKPAQKIAATILGIFGLGILIATKVAITGGAIGSLPSSVNFVGVGLMIVSLIWMWKAFKMK